MDNTNAEVLKLLQQLTVQLTLAPAPAASAPAAPVPAQAPAPMQTPVSAPVQAPAEPAASYSTNLEILKLLKQLVNQQSEPQETTTTRSRPRRKERSSTPVSSSSRSPSPARSCNHSSKKTHKPSRVRRDILRYLPKTLTFDGTGRWRSFKRKFDAYAKMNDLTSEECRTILCWCMTGKAMDYYDIIIDRDEKMSYEAISEKLETRYGVRELQVTAMMKFNAAMQTKEESIEDWSDRLLILASPAFRGCKEDYATTQLVYRFCQGLVDKEAALQIGAQNPATLEDALEKVQWFQCMRHAVYEHPSSTRSKDTDAELD